MRRGGELADEFLEGGHVRRHALQNEVDLARQHPAFPHQRLLADKVLECLEIGIGLARQMHRGEHGDVEAEQPRIEQAAVTLDVTGLFQRPHPTQAGRRRDADPLGQFDIGDAAVGLDLGENLEVDLV